jgi:hypothetical protein
LVFSGCLSFGDDDDTKEDTDGSTGNTDDWDVFSIASVTSLPPCDSATFGRLYYVEADENFQVCRTNGWEVIDIGSVGGISHPGNNAPLVTADILFVASDEAVTEDNVTDSMKVYVTWSAIDVDGAISSAGFDMDLDMVIDVPVSTDSGTTIDTPTNSAFPGALSIPLNQGWTYDRTIYVLNGEPYCILNMHHTFAFVAEDDDGAVSAELLHLREDYTANQLNNDVIASLNFPQADADWIMSADCAGEVEPPGPPFAQFTSTKSSGGDYYVTVVQVSTKYDLEAFSYFLKDSTGTTIEFGEIAMQNLSGNVVGIDVSYDDTCDDNCDADLQTRSDAVNDDSGAVYAVTFNDNDRDGKLSAGDKFTARGSGHSSDGPADDDWSLEVKFDNTGDVVASKRLG